MAQLSDFLKQNPPQVLHRAAPWQGADGPLPSGGDARFSFPADAVGMRKQSMLPFSYQVPGPLGASEDLRYAQPEPGSPHPISNSKWEMPRPTTQSQRDAVKNLIENRGGVAVPGEPAQAWMAAHPQYDALGRRIRDTNAPPRLVDFIQIDQDARARDEALRNRLRQEAAARQAQAQAGAGAAQPGAGGAAGGPGTLQEAIQREVASLYPKYPKGTTFIDELRGHNHARRFFEPGNPEAVNPNWSPRTGYVPKLPTRAQLAQARSAGLASFLGQSQEDRLGRVANATVDTQKNSQLLALLETRRRLGELSPEEVEKMSPAAQAQYFKERSQAPKGMLQKIDEMIEKISPGATSALAKQAESLQASASPASAQRAGESNEDYALRMSQESDQAEYTADALSLQLARNFPEGDHGKPEWYRRVLEAGVTGKADEAIELLGVMLLHEPDLTERSLTMSRDYLRQLDKLGKLDAILRKPAHKLTPEIKKAVELARTPDHEFQLGPLHSDAKISTRTPGEKPFWRKRFIKPSSENLYSSDILTGSQ